MKTFSLILSALGIFGSLNLAMLSTVSANPMGTAEMKTDRPGQDYHHFQANHFSICATSCATIEKCRAYTYVSSTKTCWLKDSVPKPTSNNCCISGVKLMSAPEFNVDRPGSDIKPGFPVTTSSDCETQCLREPTCRAYTFVKPGIQGETAKCWLKSGKPKKVGNNCCVSGYRLAEPLIHRIEPKLLIKRP